MAPATFAIEHLSEKGWQIIWEGYSMTLAIQQYRKYLLSDDDSYRLTFIPPVL